MNRELRIGFDAVRALRNSTGLGNYARRVLRGVLAPGTGIVGALYSKAPPRPEYAGLAAELGAPLQLPPGPWRLPGAQSWWRTFRLGRQAAASGIALYHGLSHELPRDLPREIPAVVSFADLLWERYPGLYRPADRRSYRWRYRWSARRANAVVALSRETRDALVECYGLAAARICVIPPPADARFARPIPNEARRGVLARYGLPEEFLLSVGTWEARKNQRTAIMALSALDAARTPPLVLVGRDGGSGAELRQLAERVAPGRVRFASAVRDADLPAVMQSASLFLYPSLAEGFGLPIVEALGAGVPVIASEGGCFREAGGPGTLYAPATDAVALASVVRRVLDDPELADRMRAAGRQHAERFESGRVTTRMLALYDAVIAPGAPPLPEY